MFEENVTLLKVGWHFYQMRLLWIFNILSTVLLEAYGDNKSVKKMFGKYFCDY